MPQPLRTFIAVETPPPLREAAGQLAALLQASGADVKWVEPENLHLTLKFLGDVAAERIPEVCKAVGRALEGQEPCEVEVRGAGAFPRPQRPRTLWLGISEGHEPLRRIFTALERELAKRGFPKEHRPFEPHLTLGRVREGRRGLEELARLIEENRDYSAGRIHVTELVVFSSQLDRHGPTHTPLARLALREAGEPATEP
jgi:2'-5' RNA ligase